MKPILNKIALVIVTIILSFSTNSAFAQAKKAKSTNAIAKSGNRMYGKLYLDRDSEIGNKTIE